MYFEGDGGNIREIHNVFPDNPGVNMSHEQPKLPSIEAIAAIEAILRADLAAILEAEAAEAAEAQVLADLEAIVQIESARLESDPVRADFLEDWLADVEAWGMEAGE